MQTAITKKSGNEARTLISAFLMFPNNSQSDSSS
jgi:hypothetical protein